MRLRTFKKNALKNGHRLIELLNKLLMYHSNLYCHLNSEILLEMTEGSLTMDFHENLLQLPNSAWTLGNNDLQKATEMAKE